MNTDYPPGIVGTPSPIMITAKGDILQRIRRLQAFEPSRVTMISGSSAAADIEMTRIKSVHGPRTLDVILIEP